VRVTAIKSTSQADNQDSKELKKERLKHGQKTAATDEGSVDRSDKGQERKGLVDYRC